MVDYVSVGHFEIFDRLVKQSKLFGGQSISEKSVSLLQEIQITTQIILDFNDKYISTDDFEALIIDLASLGKTFVQRFAEEDKLVDLLHSSNISYLIGGKGLDVKEG
jgi:regulator of sigma D